MANDHQLDKQQERDEALDLKYQEEQSKLTIMDDVKIPGGIIGKISEFGVDIFNGMVKVWYTIDGRTEFRWVDRTKVVKIV